MRRRLLNLLTTLSLLLCVAVVALWARSHLESDSLFWRRGESTGDESYRSQSVTVRTLRGGVQAEWFKLAARTGMGWGTPTDTPLHWDTSTPIRRPEWTEPISERSLGVLSSRCVWPEIRKGSIWEVPAPILSATSSSDATFDNEAYRIVLPYWLVVVPLAAMALVPLLTSTCRRRRISRGHCASCGYDLRATPDGCPECGTPGVRGTIAAA